MVMEQILFSQNPAYRAPDEDAYRAYLHNRNARWDVLRRPPRPPVRFTLGNGRGWSARFFYKSTQKRTGFNDLPMELLYMVRDSIPDSALFTHLAFSSTCTTIRKMYDDDCLWGRYCSAFGIGQPMGFHPLEDDTWKQTALRIANHLHSCPDEKHCFLWLTYNGLPKATKYKVYGGCYAWLISLYKNFSFYETLAHDPEVLEDYDIQCTAFRTVMKLDLSCDEPEAKTAWTRHVMYNPNGHSCFNTLTLNFLDHPTFCMYASNPPVTQMEVVISDAMGFFVGNDMGVTVWDVVMALQEALSSHYMDLVTFIYLFRTYRKELPALKRVEWLGTKTFKDICDMLEERSTSGQYEDVLNASMKTAKELIRQAVPGPEFSEQCVADVLWNTFNGDLSGFTAHGWLTIMNHFFPFLKEMEEWREWMSLCRTVDIYKDCLFGGLVHAERGSSRFNVVWHYPIDRNVRMLLAPCRDVHLV